eukprot:1655403-Pleurochrysis_carterae.AAC.1
MPRMENARTRLWKLDMILDPGRRLGAAMRASLPDQKGELSSAACTDSVQRLLALRSLLKGDPPGRAPVLL